MLVAILGHQHIGQQPWAGHAARDRPAGRRRLEDRFASDAGQLGPHMPDHLEARGHILQLLGDVVPDQTKTTAASGAAARLTTCVVVRAGCLRSIDLALARQVGGELAIDLRCVGGIGRVRRDRRRAFIQWFVFQKRDLRVIELLAGRSEARAKAAQQLQLELVDHQLEEHHLGVSLLDHSQQTFDGVGCGGGVGGRRHVLHCAERSARRTSVLHRRILHTVVAQLIRRRAAAHACAPACASRCLPAASRVGPA